MGMKNFKIIVFLVGLLPTAWYVYQIQGKLMAHLNTKTVLDLIAKPDDALAIFPKTTQKMQELAQEIKKLTLERVDAIKVIPAAERTFDNTVRAGDSMNADIEKGMSLLHMCQMVYPDKELRETAEKLILELQNFIVDNLTLNKDLYNAFMEYVNGNKAQETLNSEEEFYISESLKSFKRSGYDLPDEQQAELKRLQKELAELTQLFNVNIAKDVRFITVSRQDLQGLTDEQVAPYLDELSGKYILKTDYPTVDLVLQNCTLESTRKALWVEFNNRAHPNNNEILKKVIKIRHQIAELLGYPSYTYCNLDDSMAQSPERVQNFLKELETRSTAKAQQEFEELVRQLPEGITLTADGKLKPWDARYVMYQYKKQHAAIDERAIAEYFPLEKTIDVLLELYEEFLGLRFEQLPAQGLWHSDVKLIKATQDDKLLGYLFLDLHPRDNKYTHACNLSIIHGLHNKQGDITVPVVTVVIANFPKSTGEKPALLMRSDVNTFFHEFGHAVHALCGITELNAFSGTNVKRDFVELPSQMLEEWLWQPEVLKRISGHYKSGIKLHDELIAAIIKIKNLDTGFFLKRQISLAYLSLACFNEHIDDDMKHEYQLLFERLMPYQDYCPEENFISSFGHLMGYGAQYYGYLWSKVFALDLFDYIKEHGLSGKVGARYRDLVIGKGGSKDPYALLVDFLGREPNSDAFFKDMGI